MARTSHSEGGYACVRLLRASLGNYGSKNLCETVRDIVRDEAHSATKLLANKFLNLFQF